MMILKKSVLFVLTILMFSFSQIYAQGLHIGIKAGTNLGNISGRAFEGGFHAGFTAGGFVELKATGKWGLQGELLYSQMNTKTTSEFLFISAPTPGNGIPNRDVTLNYLNIPVMLSYSILPILSLQAGPQFGILLSTSDNILVQGKAFKDGDFGLAFGAQVNLLKFKGGVRYVYGLTDISEVTPTDTWKTQSFSIYIGFRLF